MRNTFRKLFLEAYGLFLKPKPGIHIINAHYLNPGHINKERTNQFLNQLESIQKHGALIRIEEAAELIEKKKNPKKALVAFTFDDGFKECYTKIAPILESFQTNAAFFINPNFVECNDSYYQEFSKRVTVNGKKSMNWSEIKELQQRGHIIGSHTLDHINLGEDLKDEDLQYQLRESKLIIENKIGNDCNMFAFPYGRKQHLSEKALKVASQNYRYIFSGTDYKNYLSFNEQVINRRHIEPFWPINHMNYFLSAEKKFDE